MQALPVPKALKQKLVFGDEEQIKALSALEAESIRRFGDGTKKKYDVFIEVEYSETITVFAESEHEAIRKAKDDFDISLSHHDFDFTAEEVKG